MAPSPRTGSRQDATALPSMSSTFWAFMILASLLIAYCSQLAAGTCEIVTLDRDSSQPRRTIARQTARCACRKGQIAGTTRARPACVDARIIKTKQWCDMLPCLEGEGCDLLINRSGWTCTQPGGRIKTTTHSPVGVPGFIPGQVHSLNVFPLYPEPSFTNHDALLPGLVRPPAGPSELSCSSTMKVPRFFGGLSSAPPRFHGQTR
ncbi:chemokine-like protein TAFA-5 [Tenrec ecaudatus]|uniref:chemokine-like protein TAFA-5 n=1 Tax=Tenrec ecaudatus TaxID=94439 RepID=UPI003F59C4F8